MKIRTAITASERKELRHHVRQFRRACHQQDRAVVEVSVILGCHTDEATDFCNGSESSGRLLDRHGVEIAPDEPDVIPIREDCIDRETWRMWAFMSAGVALVFALVWWEFGG